MQRVRRFQAFYISLILLTNSPQAHADLSSLIIGGGMGWLFRGEADRSLRVHPMSKVSVNNNIYVDMKPVADALDRLSVEVTILGDKVEKSGPGYYLSPEAVDELMENYELDEATQALIGVPLSKGDIASTSKFVEKNGLTALRFEIQGRIRLKTIAHKLTGMLAQYYLGGAAAAQGFAIDEVRRLLDRQVTLFSSENADAYTGAGINDPQLSPVGIRDSFTLTPIQFIQDEELDRNMRQDLASLGVVIGEDQDINQLLLQFLTENLLAWTQLDAQQITYNDLYFQNPQILDTFANFASYLSDISTALQRRLSDGAIRRFERQCDAESYDEKTGQYVVQDERDWLSGVAKVEEERVQLASLDSRIKETVVSAKSAIELLKAQARAAFPNAPFASCVKLKRSWFPLYADRFDITLSQEFGGGSFRMAYENGTCAEILDKLNGSLAGVIENYLKFSTEFWWPSEGQRPGFFPSGAVPFAPNTEELLGYEKQIQPYLDVLALIEERPKLPTDYGMYTYYLRLDPERNNYYRRSPQAFTYQGIESLVLHSTWHIFNQIYRLSELKRLNENLQTRLEGASNQLDKRLTDIDNKTKDREECLMLAQAVNQALNDLRAGYAIHQALPRHLAGRLMVTKDEQPSTNAAQALPLNLDRSIIKKFSNDPLPVDRRDGRR